MRSGVLPRVPHVTERPANCPRLTISFAMRAPEWGPPVTDLYGAALDMTAWAERVGFDEVRLSEHHETTDGYLPSPIVLAAGLGARTSTIGIKLFVVLATLQHPIHLAEDLAVADLVTGGRLHVTLGAGYRKDEFLLFDVNWKRRPSMMVEIVETLRAGWTGEPFEFRGRTTRVLPRPARPGGPPLSLAGASIASGIAPRPSIWRVSPSSHSSGRRTARSSPVSASRCRHAIRHGRAG